MGKDELPLPECFEIRWRQSKWSYTGSYRWDSWDKRKSEIGIAEKSNIVTGNYYSVNPTALERIPKLYCQNKREWSIFHSKNFGDIIHVEVGATCVGSIIQSYTPNKKVKKGDEKGYFKFGGSTTILFFKKDMVSIDDDILLQSSFGFESKVNMGEKIGEKLK